MFKFLHSKKGFTLTELLVVVTIIGVIGAVAFPLFGTIIENNKKTACEKSQNVVYSAFRQYTEKIEMVHAAKIKIDEEDINKKIEEPEYDCSTKYEGKYDGFLYVKGEYAYYEYDKFEKDQVGEGNYIATYTEYPRLETGTIKITKNDNSEKGYDVDPGKTGLDVGILKKLFDRELCCSNENNHLEITVSSENGLFDGYVVNVKCVGSDGVQTNHVCSRESAVM